MPATATDTDTEPAVPATSGTAVPAPVRHPMDPRRGESLSPPFAAFLCWLLDLPPMTDPAIANICVNGNSVLAATSDNPLFDAHLGSADEFERNLRGWGEVCAAPPPTIEDLVARFRRAGR